MMANPSRISHPASPPQGDVELLERLTRARADLLAQVGRRIVGQHQVPAAGETHPPPAPFFVLATQNPSEQGGTYPLPEAQLDRFVFEWRVAYPTKEEEGTIVEAATGDRATGIAPVLTAEDVLALQHLVRRIPVPKPL